MIDWIRKKKPFGLFAQGNGSFVHALRMAGAAAQRKQ